MKKFVQLPGAALAVGAFVLTVLLGVGGTAASALWQQSATATMSVTANGTWPGQLICSSALNSDKYVNLAYTLSGAPTGLALAAKKADGTYGPASAVTPVDPTGTIQLSGTSTVLTQSNGMSVVSVRLTASYADHSTMIAETTVRLDAGTSNGKIYCS
ncbi:hypothetical protein [Pseudarthrobacter sulfonivorans]|uniref:hypothetical protein n=1 Tax=Pseudarthrobacter sulfonivorans TaxID=121292 RepID=UPI002106F73C|nr:hypothetical protein [Pseudarthrobacter sulfonivorans]